MDGGKAFCMIQAGGGTLMKMDENIRQRTDQLRTVAALANIGKASAAMKVLGDRVIESAEPAVSAADMWLALSQPERDATAVFSSCRDSRQAITQRLQPGPPDMKQRWDRGCQYVYNRAGAGPITKKHCY